MHNTQRMRMRKKIEREWDRRKELILASMCGSNKIPHNPISVLRIHTGIPSKIQILYYYTRNIHSVALKVIKKKKHGNILDLSKIDIAQSQEEWDYSLLFCFSWNIRLECEGGCTI